MLTFIRSIVGLITAILALIAAIITLIGACRGRIPRRFKEKVGEKVPYGVGAILFIAGLSMLYVRVAYKLPKVTIVSPSGSVDVTAEGNSVWFSVSGTSSGVASNNALTIYVLVWSDPEWHVQRPANVESDGRWILTRAWIGDAAAPINAGDAMRLMAVVSQGRYNPGDKFPDYRQLNPVATSEIVSARVATVRGR